MEGERGGGHLMAALMNRCDWCEMSTVATDCPGTDAHCALGQHCITVVEVCALEWRGGENPGGHPRTCEHCGADLRVRSTV